MAIKKKKSGGSKSEALRQMREGAPKEETVVGKKAMAKQAKADKAAKLKADKADKKAAEKKERDEQKAKTKELKLQQAADKKAAKEAAKKPKTGLLTVEQIPYLPKGAMEPLPELSDEQRVKMADEGDKEIRQLQGRFIRAAIIFRGYMHYRLWEQAVNPETGKRGFKSIEKWAASAMPMISRSERFKLIKVADSVVPHIAEDDLKKIGQRNAQLLINVPKAKLQDPEVIKAAQGSESGLRKKLAKDVPEAGVEENRAVVVPQSVKTAFSEAIDAITVLHEYTTKEEAYEGLAEYFMQGQTESERFPGMSNREAYQKLQDAENGEEEPEDVEEIHVNGEHVEERQ
jgi:hypothetical protein